VATKVATEIEQAEFLRDGIRSRIRVLLDSLHPAELRVAQVVLAQPSHVVQLPIAELASLADVSQGTVVRFSTTVGCQGFQAFKLALAADLAQPALVLHEDIVPEDALNPEIVAQKVLASDILALQDTLKLLDPKALRQAADAIDAASELVFFAVGTSHAVAADAATRYLRIGFRAQAPLDAHDQLVVAATLPRTGVVVGISHSGASREPVECLELARGRGATTIAVTSRHPSPLTEQADITLLTVSTETRYREDATASRIAQLSLLDSLVTTVALRRPDAALDALKTTSEALASHRVA
jgi:RpiR family transcriptional regulator, carbohydrate utilization regulator